MYRTFHLQHQQPAQKAMGALGITLRILKNLKPDPFCLFQYLALHAGLPLGSPALFCPSDDWKGTQGVRF